MGITSSNAKNPELDKAAKNAMQDSPTPDNTNKNVGNVQSNCNTELNEINELKKEIDKLKKEKYVNSETETYNNVIKNNNTSNMVSPTSSAPVPSGNVMSTTSDSATSPGPVPSVNVMSTTSESPIATASEPVRQREVQPEPVRPSEQIRDIGRGPSSRATVYRPPEQISQRDLPHHLREHGQIPPQERGQRPPVPQVRTETMLGGSNIVNLDPSIFATSEREFKGGYSNVADSSVTRSELEVNYNGGQDRSSIINLDPSVFETSEAQYGGQNSVQNNNTSEFNPEKFFNDLQVGGLPKPTNKEHKKKHLDKYLSPEEDDDSDDEDKFNFAETTDGLDVDENEDTEDLKQKVKHLRMMVSRSTGKKSSKKSKSRKAKRVTTEETDSTGGADNSISEYVNSTSSISTSDVRLISMNKMRKH